MHCNSYVVRSKGAAGDGTILWLPRGDGVTGVHDDGGLRAVYVWQNIFSSSLSSAAIKSVSLLCGLLTFTDSKKI